MDIAANFHRAGTSVHPVYARVIIIPNENSLDRFRPKFFEMPPSTWVAFGTKDPEHRHFTRFSKENSLMAVPVYVLMFSVILYKYHVLFGLALEVSRDHGVRHDCTHRFHDGPFFALSNSVL